MLDRLCQGLDPRSKNLRLQLDALNAAGCERLYTEMASGAQRDRPELKAALDYAREGDTLWSRKSTGWRRSLKQLIEETVEGLEQRKVGFRSLTEAIDTTTAGGRLVFQIFGAFAEFERQVIRERTIAGLTAARRARGRRGAQTPCPLRQGISLLPRQCSRIQRSRCRGGGTTASGGASTLYRHLPGGRARSWKAVPTSASAFVEKSRAGGEPAAALSSGLFGEQKG